MAHIRTKELEAGMTLSMDVSDNNGRLLLGKGCELSDKHILALKAWGVTSVDIEEDEPTQQVTVSEIPEDIMEAVRNEVAGHFKYSNTEHPFIQAIMEKAVVVKAAEYMREGGH